MYISLNKYISNDEYVEVLVNIEHISLVYPNTVENYNHLTIVKVLDEQFGFGVKESVEEIKEILFISNRKK